MTNTEQQPIIIRTMVDAPAETVWERWTAPEHITRWSFAGQDWHAPKAENDLRPGGRFTTRMEAKDGSMGFDFGGTYDEVQAHTRISYTLDDARKVEVRFEARDGKTEITETFEPEHTNPREMQEAGWQMILENFKRYAES